ncbi:hypothetical protein L6R50_28015 [Myxococcota bacterium]|nr:hypothetical protein [Myxococcota bacterium]
MIYQSRFADPPATDDLGGWSNIHCKGAELSWFPSAWSCTEPCADPFEPWAGYTVCDGNVDWDDAINRTDNGALFEGSIRIWLYDEAGDGESVPTAYLTLFTEAVPEYPDVTSQLPPDFEFTPCYVYVFSAWVHTESVLSNPALGVDWLSGVDADGAPLVIPNGTYDDGQVERDTLPFPVGPIAAPWPAWNGWHRLEVPAVAPRGAVGARLRLLTRTVGDRFVPTTMAGGPGVPEFDPQPSSFWFDDVEVEEFPSLKFVANAGDAAWLDPDWTFLVPIGAEVVQPDVVEVVGGDGTASFVLASDASFCGELVIELPPGVSLTAVTGDDPGTIDDERNVRASAVVNRGTDPISGYTAYAFEYSGDPVSGCASGTSGTIFTEQTFEWLFLSTVAPPLSELPANLYYRFEWDTPGGTVQQPTQTVVLSPFTLPVLAPEDRPQRLRVDAMASTSLGIPNGDWPGYLDLLGATGVHSFTLDSSIQAAWKSAAYRAEVESVRDEAVGVHELGLRGLLAPFSYITADGPAAIDTTTVAKNALGELPDASWDLCAGAANLPVVYEICVDPPDTHYTDELDALCVAGEMGVAWIAFDWEGRDQRTFCDPAVSQFMTLYADADEDGVLGEFRRGGTVDHGDDPRFIGPWTDTAEVHGGSRSLGIVRGYGYTSPVSGSVYRTVPLLPPRITDLEGPGPYQLSAYVHTESVVGSPELSIRWLADDGVTELGEASALLPAPGGAWNEEVLSAEAPAEAAFAEVHLGVVDLAGGTVRFDDVDFRVDGPYVNPYVTAGWNGQEVDSRQTLEQLLEAFVGGAQAVTSFVFRGYSGQDLARVAQAATMLHAAQDIVADGRPIPDESLYAVGTWPWDPADPLQPRAMGMEFDDRVLVLVSY